MRSSETAISVRRVSRVKTKDLSALDAPVLLRLELLGSWQPSSPPLLLMGYAFSHLLHWPQLLLVGRLLGCCWSPLCGSGCTAGFFPVFPVYYICFLEFESRKAGKKSSVFKNGCSDLSVLINLLTVWVLSLRPTFSITKPLSFQWVVYVGQSTQTSTQLVRFSVTTRIPRYGVPRRPGRTSSPLPTLCWFGQIQDFFTLHVLGTARGSDCEEGLSVLLLLLTNYLMMLW